MLRSNEVLNLSGAAGMMVAAREVLLQIICMEPASNSPAG
jgi:hypothetical protein